MQRGSLVTVANPSAFLSKPRPAIVIQATECLAMRDSVTVCPLTGFEDADMANVRPVLLPTPENGLEKPSAVQIDKVITVPKQAVSVSWGHASPAEMKKISSALAFWLGIS